MSSRQNEDVSNNNESSSDGRHADVASDPGVVQSIINGAVQTRRVVRAIHAQRPRHPVDELNAYARYSMMVSMGTTGDASQTLSQLQPVRQNLTLLPTSSGTRRSRSDDRADMESETFMRNTRARLGVDHSEVPLVTVNQPREPTLEREARGVEDPPVDLGVTVRGGQPRNSIASSHSAAPAVREIQEQPPVVGNVVVLNVPDTNVPTPTLSLEQLLHLAVCRRRQVFALVYNSQHLLTADEIQHYIYGNGWPLNGLSVSSHEALLRLIARLLNANVAMTEDEITARLWSQTCGSTDEGQCAICLDNYAVGDIITELECGHKYHLACIIEWLLRKNNCPFCRRTVLNT